MLMLCFTRCLRLSYNEAVRDRLDSISPSPWYAYLTGCTLALGLIPHGLPVGSGIGGGHVAYLGLK